LIGLNHAGTEAVAEFFESLSSWRAWPQVKLRKNVPSVEGSEHTVAEHRLGRSRPQGVAVIDGVTAGQGGVDDAHGLVSDVGPPRRIAQVHTALEERAKAKVLSQSRRQDQPGVGDEMVIVEDHLDGVEGVRR
jgi:hypothetical protein